MSHTETREEKNCLNCGTIVAGQYCQHCGQENLPPQESVWHFLTHFVNDITHFDGKFFKTLQLLLFRPGFLTAEYMRGRRATYLNPIRMYLFTSFIFFFIFYSAYNSKVENLEIFSSTENQAADSLQKPPTISISNKNYKSVAEYDSIMRAKKPQDRDNWITQKIRRKQISVQQKYGDNQYPFFKELIHSFFHQFPKMLFFSLPLVALVLMLLYIRHKEFYFVIHGVFVIQLYIFVFIAKLISMGVEGFATFTHWHWFTYLNYALFIWVLFYIYKAMRNFYRQKRLKTIIKYLLFLFSFAFIMLSIFIVFFIETFLNA